MKDTEVKKISYDEYKEKFGLDQECEKSTCKKEEALKHALDIRKFEIDLYWKRAAYFWTFIATTMAGYILIQKTKSPENAYLSVVVSCLGFIFSFAWFFVNKGSKYWQENWENHVDLLEDSVVGPLYKIVTGRPEKDKRNLQQHKSVPEKKPRWKGKKSICGFLGMESKSESKDHPR